MITDFFINSFIESFRKQIPEFVQKNRHIQINISCQFIPAQRTWDSQFIIISIKDTSCNCTWEYEIKGDMTTEQIRAIFDKIKNHFK